MSEQMLQHHSNLSYLGNANVKRDGVQQKWSQETINEYAKCLRDPTYFAENYIKVISLDDGLVPFRLYPYQNQMINHFNDHRFSIVLACRQSGKSLTSCAYLLWYAIFYPEKTVAILANKGATAKEMLGRITLMLENLPFFLQPGCKALNKTSIEFSNNSKIISSSTSSSSIRGMSCVPDYTRVCVLLENDDIYYTSIENANYINKNEGKFIEEKYGMNHSKKYNFVYKTTNIINGKEYTGYHGTDNLDDGYLGSGKLLKRAIEKYGPESFIREILEFFDNPKDAFEYEKKIVNEEYVKRDDTYNLSIGGNVCILYGESNGFYGKSHSNETKSKIREKRLGKSVHTEESKRKISEKSKQRWKDPDYRKRTISSLSNRIVTDETRKKLRDAHLGKTFSEETKQKISNARLNFFSNMSEEEYTEWYNSTHGPDQRKKRSESLSGRTKSKEWVDKINKNPEKIKKTAETHRGMKRSEESKKKMSAAKKGKRPHNLGKIYIHNPITKEKRMIYKDEPIPEGFKRGFLKLNENTK